MKVTVLNKYVATNIDLEAQSELELPTEGAAKALLMNMIINNQYEDPLKAACREALQNALDANKEAGNQHLPITIHLPTTEEPQLVISDRGNGIDAERFHQVYKKIGHSTKSSDNDFMGGYGMGRVSMLAVASQVLINSVAAGIYYQHSAYIKESGNIGFATFSAEPTDKLSGTEIVIPIDTVDHHEVNRHIKELTNWVEQPVEVYLSGELCDNTQNTEKHYLRGLYKGYKWYFKPQHDTTSVAITVLQGDLPYQLTSKLLQDHLKHKQHRQLCLSYDSMRNELVNELVIRMPVGSLELTQSRENLRVNEANRKALEFIPLLLEQVKEKLQEELLSQPKFREVLRKFYEQYPLPEFEFSGIRFTRVSPSCGDKDCYRIDDYSKVFPKKCTIIWGSNNITKSAIEKKTKLSKATSPLIESCSANLLRFLDCVWVVYPEGTTKVKFEFRVRHALNIPTSKHILCIPTQKDPKEYIEAHPLLSLLGDVLVYEPVVKERKSEPKPASLKSLVKSGSARTLLANTTSLGLGVYSCTEKVFELPESGIYIETETAKPCLHFDYIPQWFDKSLLFFVSNSIAEKLKLNPQWKSFSDYCKETFIELVTIYREGLELLDWSIDSSWVSGGYYFCGIPCNQFLAHIVEKSISSDSSLNQPKLSLAKLLLSPNRAFWLSKISYSLFITFGEGEEWKELLDFKDKLRNNTWSLSQYKTQKAIWSLSQYERGKQYSKPNEYAALKVPIFRELAEKYPLLMLLIQNVELGSQKAFTEENLPLAERNLLESIDRYMEQINAIHS